MSHSEHSLQTTGDSNPNIMTSFYADLYRHVMSNTGFYWSHYAPTPFVYPAHLFPSPFPFYGCPPTMNAHPTYLPNPTNLNPSLNTAFPVSDPSPTTPVPGPRRGRKRWRRQGKKDFSRKVTCACVEDQRSLKRRRNFPASAVEQLKAWFDAHLHRPYASKKTLEKLSETTGLSGKQVRKWISNQRDRTGITKSCNRQ